MKHVTLKEIVELKNILAGRIRRIEALKKKILGGVSAKDYAWIKAELDEHEKFQKKAERIIKKFYAPAVV